MRKGGTALAIRQLIYCIVLLMVLIGIGGCNLIRIKRNYTDLHHRVSTLEQMFNNLNKGEL